MCDRKIQGQFLFVFTRNDFMKNHNHFVFASPRATLQKIYCSFDSLLICAFIYEQIIVLPLFCVFFKFSWALFRKIFLQKVPDFKQCGLKEAGEVFIVELEKYCTEKRSDLVFYLGLEINLSQSQTHNVYLSRYRSPDISAF